MKNLSSNFKAASMLSIFISAFAIVALSSCAKKMTFGISTVTPAATGSIKIKQDKNDNYAIDVSLRNLAPSNRLTPPKETYIVWVETESNGVKNIGQFNTSGSKELKGSLSTKVPFKPKKIFITAEDTQNVQFPTGIVVLTTDSN